MSLEHLRTPAISQWQHRMWGESAATCDCTSSQRWSCKSNPQLFTASKWSHNTLVYTVIYLEPLKLLPVIYLESAKLPFHFSKCLYVFNHVTHLHQANMLCGDGGPLAAEEPSMDNRGSINHTSENTQQHGQASWLLYRSSIKTHSVDVNSKWEQVTLQHTVRNLRPRNTAQNEPTHNNHVWHWGKPAVLENDELGQPWIDAKKHFIYLLEQLGTIFFYAWNLNNIMSSGNKVETQI